MELVCEAGPDGPEVRAYVDGRILTRADFVGGFGYHVWRDSIAPEMETAVQALEDGPGTRSTRLDVGESVGVDVPAPTPSQVDAARALPLYRPRPSYRPGGAP